MIAPQLVGSLSISHEKIKSAAIQKGQLKANVCYQPQYSANVEVKHLPLDVLELASLRGTIQKIAIEKTVLEQANSRYELQGEYVLPGRDRHNTGKKKSGLWGRAMAGHLGSVISSIVRWRMRLEIPGVRCFHLHDFFLEVKTLLFSRSKVVIGLLLNVQTLSCRVIVVFLLVHCAIYTNWTMRFGRHWHFLAI
ncbi:hypothetical protein C5167_021709 [Papaver somniferum]|uniref:Uncharacterized protein n=1 Tax=Papaver somniferum TaxID=3469 RepID=A0A4Y7JHF2_PAPSO|nr:hypothetical protein C5167_021709 [Papaver somniferum]